MSDFLPSLVKVSDGEWAGWSVWAGEPFEDMAGPFYSRVDASGPVCALRVEPRHLNGFGSVHGGLLAAFADSAIFALSADCGSEDGVTISLALQYVRAAKLGDIIEARAETVNAIGRTIFISGAARVLNDTVFGFTGIIKLRRPRA